MFSNPQNVLGQVHVDPGMITADFGCGLGYYTLVLSDLVGPSGKVFGYDIQKDLLGRLKTEITQKGIENIELIWADLDEPNSTKLKENTLDRVIMTNILFQVEDKKALIREAKRVLKKSGKVVVVDWMDSFGGLGPHKADVVKKEIAKRIFEEEGFVLEREINAGEHHYGLVFKI